MKVLLLAGGVVVAIFAVSNSALESESIVHQAAAPIAPSEAVIELGQEPRPVPREVASCMIDARQIGLVGEEMRDFVRWCLTETG
jgi:hypothetical protein